MKLMAPKKCTNHREKFNAELKFWRIREFQAGMDNH